MFKGKLPGSRYIGQGEPFEVRSETAFRDVPHALPASANRVFFFQASGEHIVPIKRPRKLRGIIPGTTPTGNEEIPQQTIFLEETILQGGRLILPKRLIRALRKSFDIKDRNLSIEQHRKRDEVELAGAIRPIDLTQDPNLQTTIHHGSRRLAMTDSQILAAREDMKEVAAMGEREAPTRVEETLPPERSELVRSFEQVLNLIDTVAERDFQRSIEYGERFSSEGETVVERNVDAAMKVFRQFNLYDLITNRPLEYLSGPIPIATPDQWWTERGLIETTAHFYSPIGSQIAVEFANLIENSLAQSLDFRTRMRTGTLEPNGAKPYSKENIITAIKSLAGIRGADCQYYDKLFFSGQVNPQAAIANMATFYEGIIDRLTRQSSPNEIRGDVKEVVTVLQDEAKMLRIIQAQEYQFITFQRPLPMEIALLPIMEYLGQEVEKERREGKTPEFQKHAREIVQSFSAHRCSLTNDDVFKIIRFFMGETHQKSLEGDSPLSVKLPWIILNQEVSGQNEEAKLNQLRDLGFSREQAAALSKFSFDLGLMGEMVPDLLFEFRKQGYFQGVKVNNYKMMGFKNAEMLFQDHQARLVQIEENKNPMKIKQGSTVGVYPLSAWTITKAHHDAALAAQRLMPSYVKLMEIRRGLPITDRECVVILTLGDVESKKMRGMATVHDRIPLVEQVIRYDEGIYVVPEGYVDESRRRSIRVKQMLANLGRDFGVTFSLTGPTGETPQGSIYPGKDCLAFLIGGTEKLGANGATKFVLESHKPDQDIGFLNTIAQVMGILSNDISHPTAMTSFILGLLENFSAPGILALATRSAELHSTQTAFVAREYILAKEVRHDEAAARQCELIFKTQVDAPIWSRGWEMMLERARGMLEEERQSKVKLWRPIHARLVNKIAKLEKTQALIDLQTEESKERKKLNRRKKELVRGVKELTNEEKVIRDGFTKITPGDVDQEWDHYLKMRIRSNGSK